MTQAFPMKPNAFLYTMKPKAFPETQSELPWIMRESLKILTKSLNNLRQEILKLIPLKNFGGIMALRPKFMVQDIIGHDEEFTNEKNPRGPYGARV